MYRIIKTDYIPRYPLHPNINFSELKQRIDHGKFEALYVYLKDEVIEAILLTWKNRFHPHAQYIAIEAIKYSSDLTIPCSKVTRQQNIVVCSCWSNEHEKISYLEQLGFKLFRKTYMPTYSTNSLLQQLHDIPMVEAVSLNDVLKSEKGTKALFTLVKHSYEQAHLANPVLSMSWEEWKHKLLDNNIDMDAKTIVVHRDDILGFMFVYPVDDEWYSIGLIGKRVDLDILVLLKTVLYQLNISRINKVEFEIDTTDHIAYELSEFLQLSECESWNSYKRMVVMDCLDRA